MRVSLPAAPGAVGLSEQHLVAVQHAELYVVADGVE
jgi:hypothetical protein